MLGNLKAAAQEQADADKANEQIEQRLPEGATQQVASAAVEVAANVASGGDEEEKGEAKMSFSGVSERSTSSIEPKVSFSYQPGGPKKSMTILTPHLDITTCGSMSIELENASQSIAVGQQVRGVIKVDLREAYEARALTLCLRGYQRSSFVPMIAGDQFQKQGKMQRVARNIITKSFTVA